MKYITATVVSIYSIIIILYAISISNELDAYKEYYDGVERAIDTCQRLTDFAKQCEKLVPPERKEELKQRPSLEQL